MPTILEEKEPGVYIRSSHADEDLDFLWNTDRRKTPEPERFHIGFFAGGALVGSLITLVACTFFYQGGKVLPAVLPAQPKAVVEQPAVAPIPAPVKVVVSEEAPKQEKKSQGFSMPALKLPIGSPAKAPEPAAVEAPRTRLYEVQSGDTLGSIALKFYDSTNPSYIELIQQANKMPNPDALKLGQKLTIPASAQPAKVSVKTP